MKNTEVMLSGVFTGVSGLFARMAMVGTELSTKYLPVLITNPAFWLSCLCGGLGFAFLQVSLHRHEISFVGPAVSSIAITTPVILAVVLLNEFVPLSRWVGVGLLLLGIIGIHHGERQTVVSRLYSHLKNKHG